MIHLEGREASKALQENGEKSFKMRDATPEEREAVDKYIKSISKPTGVNFGDLEDGESISKENMGHWIWQTEDIYQCSECGENLHVKEVMNKPQYAWCPICGHPMKIER